MADERFKTMAAASAVPESDYQYLAEYIVNDIHGLASLFVYHRVWASEGPRFLQLRRDPALVNDFNLLDKAGAKFGRSVSSLRVSVDKLLVNFADEYKLPPVEPADAVRA